MIATGPIEALARRAMDLWGVPGLAMAIVQGDAPPWFGTWGVRDVSGGEPVDADTQFHLCSLTKSFAAAALGRVLREQGLPWTTRAAEVLPELQLHDASVTREATLQDFLAHDSGLPRHDKLWTPGDLSREEMLARLRHLPLAAGLREQNQYSNLNYLVAGAATERLAGARWEDVVTARLLRPLGFNAFAFDGGAFAAAPNHATPHVREGGTVQPGRMWPASIPAAGGLHASVRDMARWLRFLLGPDPVVRDMMQRISPIPGQPWPELENGHYGLGLATEVYRGIPTVVHGGSMPGWGALLMVVPQRELGVVVLGNRDPSPVTTFLAHAVVDAACGLEPIDWFARFAERREQALQREEAERMAAAARAPVPPPLPADAYAGRYAHPAYGTVTIDPALRWRWRGFTGALEHRGDGRFVLREDPPRRHADPLAPATFGDGCMTIGFEPAVAPAVLARQ